MRRTVLVMAVVAAAALAGCAGEANVIAEDTWDVDSGTFIEIDFEMDEGDAMSIEASAPQAFFWDVHYHDEAGSLQIVDEGTTASLSYELTAQVDGIHSLLIQNEGDEDITVDVLIEGEGTRVDFRRGAA